MITGNLLLWSCKEIHKGYNFDISTGKSSGIHNQLKSLLFKCPCLLAPNQNENNILRVQIPPPTPPFPHPKQNWITKISFIAWNKYRVVAIDKLHALTNTRRQIQHYKKTEIHKQAVSNRHIRSVHHTCFTESSFIAWCTYTLVSIDELNALSFILTWVAETLQYFCKKSVR